MDFIHHIESPMELEALLSEHELVLVDFWAQWCPYCRRIAPAFDKVGEQYADTLIAGKINYDEEPQLIQRFGIDTIPTLMLFKDGKVLGSIVAPASKAAIETFIQETLAQ